MVRLLLYVRLIIKASVFFKITINQKTLTMTKTHNVIQKTIIKNFDKQVIKINIIYINE